MNEDPKRRWIVICAFIQIGLVLFSIGVARVAVRGAERQDLQPDHIPGPALFVDNHPFLMLAAPLAWGMISLLLAAKAGGLRIATILIFASGAILALYLLKVMVLLLFGSWGVLIFHQPLAP